MNGMRIQMDFHLRGGALDPSPEFPLGSVDGLVDAFTEVGVRIDRDRSTKEVTCGVHVNEGVSSVVPLDTKFNVPSRFVVCTNRYSLKAVRDDDFSLSVGLDYDGVDRDPVLVNCSILFEGYEGKRRIVGKVEKVIRERYSGREKVRAAG